MPDRYVDYVPLGEVKIAARNPKGHDAAGIRTSIGHFGFAELPLIDERTGRLVAGHGRHEQLVAMHAAGHEPPDGVKVAEDGSWAMPVIRGWASRSDPDAESYLLASNQLTVVGGWDDTALAELLTDQAELDLLHLTGFTEGDLADLLADNHLYGSPGGAPEEARKSLAERFGVPPFTILDARQGYWQDRKRAWIALGLRSEEGRDGGMVGGFANAAMVNDQYQGRPVDDDSSGWKSGTSIFDPVLCELLVRWYSAPDAAVLDPFAGGSVRGIVAVSLGRSYLGVDLRAEQVEANEQQASAVLGGVEVLPDGADYTPALTPVEEYGDYLVKRDDSWCREGASGAKSRAMFALAEGHAGIITAGARRSPQIERAALVAGALGIGCRVHVPDGTDTPEIETCRQAGAEVIKHPAGRLNVLRSRFRDDAKARRDWYAAPFGLGVDAYAEDIASQVANLPLHVRRVVVPCGSGMTAAGILRGLDRYGRSDVRITAIALGHEPTEYLDKFGPADWRDRVDVVASEIEFDEDAATTTLGGLHLDPMYEAKCLPHLQPGDLLWVVGIRRSAPTNPTPGVARAVPVPRWVTGNAKDIRELVPDERFDLMLTCPPYFDLEVYSDDAGDLSRCADYAAFLEEYRACLAAASDRMASDAFAAIVTGALRDKKGYVNDLPSDTTRIMESLGWRLYQDAVLATSPASAGLRAGRQFEALRKLTRVHQMVGVYHRGDIGAVRSWPTPEVGDVTTEDDSPDGLA